MSEKFNSFISYVKKTFKSNYKQDIKFPKFSEMTYYHQETLLRLGLEQKFFGIEDHDIDSMLMLAHLEYMSKHYVIDNISKLYTKYKNKSDSIVNDLSCFGDFPKFDFEIVSTNEEYLIPNTFGDGFITRNRHTIKKFEISNFEYLQNWVNYCNKDKDKDKDLFYDIELLNLRVSLGE